MRLTGRRTSSNISDQRSSSGKKGLAIGGGIGAVIIGIIVTLLSGGNISDAISNVGSQLSNSQSVSSSPSFSAEDEHLYELSSKVLAGTEDVWAREFQRQGWGTYRAPKMVIYSGSIQTGCGQGSSQIGPFYCSADETVYIDLDFFKNMQSQIGASGDFAYAYVIAHEVGHHVQHLRGTLETAHNKMARLSEKEANKISVRLELEADYFAGVWAYNDNEMFGSIEPGDVENAINAASKIGDDYLQKQAYGYEIPDSFNHGRSSQRIKWLKRGIDTGNPTAYSVWTIDYTYL